MADGLQQKELAADAAIERSSGSMKLPPLPNDKLEVKTAHACSLLLLKLFAFQLLMVKSNKAKNKKYITNLRCNLANTLQQICVPAGHIKVDSPN